MYQWMTYKGNNNNDNNYDPFLIWYTRLSLNLGKGLIPFPISVKRLLKIKIFKFLHVNLRVFNWVQTVSWVVSIL